MGDPQDAGEHLLVDYLRQTLANLGQARVVRGRLVEGDGEEGPQGEAVGAPPGDAPLGVDPLEVADEQHPEVRARRERRAAHLVGVVGPAQSLDELVELGLGQEGVEAVVERMAGGLRQVGGRDEQFALVRRPTATQSHGNDLRL